jgi:hypothetical protein
MKLPKIYKFYFFGREKGAIGIKYHINYECSADSLAEACVCADNKYEIYPDVKIKQGSSVYYWKDFKKCYEKTNRS